MAGVSIKNFTRQRTPSLSYAEVAAEVLPHWDVSLVFVGEKRARNLNIKLRKKNYVPNVLSYVVGNKSGEILICLSEVAKQAPSFNLVPSAYCLYLFIHGALHLKRWVHGATMEKCEQKLLAKYVPSHSNRH